MAPAAPAAPPRKSLGRRLLRLLAWGLGALLALLLTAAGGAWWWTGTDHSLAALLRRVALYLPAEQQLESRDVSGSVRTGGHIGWLRWSSPTLAVEIQDARIGWNLAPLLQRQLQLGDLTLARVQITPQGPPSTEPAQPLSGLELPLRIQLPSIRVEELVWAAASPITLHGLQASYQYDGQAHQLRLEELRWAQGRYSAQVQLQGAAPMALDATLEGLLQAPTAPEAPPLDVAARATLKGTLAHADARLSVDAQLRPVAAAQTPATAAPGMQATLQAKLAPWASQPVEQAHAELQGVDLARLWPGAPHTALSGTLEAGPDSTGWALQAQLANALPGPWDQQHLPLDALDAQAHFDGQRWRIAQARARLGQGSVALQGQYHMADGAFEAQAQVQTLRPGLAHTAFEHSAVSGTANAQGTLAALRFAVDLHADPGPAAPRKGPALLRVDRVAGTGQWQQGTLELHQVQVQALQAQAQAKSLRITPAARAFQGDLQLRVPGAEAQIEGSLTERAGDGLLQLQLQQPTQTQAWLNRLPGLAPLLQGATLQGRSHLEARWRGGWLALQRQLASAGLVAEAPAEGAAGTFTLDAQLEAPRLEILLPPRPSEGAAGLDLQLQGVKAALNGSLAQMRAALDGQARLGTQQLTLHLRAQGGARSAGQWRLDLEALQAQAQDRSRPGPWKLALAKPLGLDLRRTPQGELSVAAAAGELAVSGPLPGQATVRWQDTRWSQNAAGQMQLQTAGELKGLPSTWLNALDAKTPPLLTRLGLASDLELEGDWNVQAAQSLEATLGLRRARGDLQLLTVGPVSRTTVQSSSQGTATHNAAAPTGTPAGLREAQLQLRLSGSTLQAQLQWDSQRVGKIQAQASSQLAFAPGRWHEAQWPATAPLAATVKAQLPDVGVWSAMAPPGWRIQGTLDADVTLSGTRGDPRWHGHLGADDMAVRSILDGVDLRNGRLRSTLDGNRLTVSEFRMAGGTGPAARILGRGGNRTAAPRDGGQLTGSGSVTWAPASGDASAAPQIRMDFQAQAEKLQVLVRADRQMSLSGQLQAKLEQGQFTLRGELTADRATIVLPDGSAPTLGSDVVVRSAAKDREAARAAEAEGAAAQASVQAARPPDLAVRFNLGNDFALQGMGITTRLTGEVDVRSNAGLGSLPRVTGEVRTEEGRYRAWGQALDVESGLVRFNGPHDNPALDILAIRPNITVRAGVQVTGSAKAPRVRLYSDPELPDAEKLSWVLLGRDVASGGSEAALLQQAALAFLGGQNSGGGVAQRFGLDEVGIKGPGSGDDATGAALTVGKRISSALYVTYEHSLSGTLGTLYLFYDLSRNLTLRGQTGLVTALDLVYTIRYD